MPPTEAEVIAAHGIKRPDITIRAARQAGLELAVACAMLMGESGGGRMVWGSDGVATGGVYQKGGPVTEANYKAYRTLTKAGKIGRQGVGDAQLTSAEFQDRGDQLGGCWDPYANQLAGFIGLANRIKQFGLRGGLRRYNGSGPAAEKYADRRMAEIATWRGWLAGATPTDGGPELNADETRKLAELHDRVVGARLPWGGGLSNVEPGPGVTPEPYDMRQEVERAVVEAHQASKAAQRCEQKLDALTQAVTELGRRIAE